MESGDTVAPEVPGVATATKLTQRWCFIGIAAFPQSTRFLDSCPTSEQGIRDMAQLVSQGLRLLDFARETHVYRPFDKCNVKEGWICENMSFDAFSLSMKYGIST